MERRLLEQPVGVVVGSDEEIVEEVLHLVALPFHGVGDAIEGERLALRRTKLQDHMPLVAFLRRVVGKTIAQIFARGVARAAERQVVFRIGLAPHVGGGSWTMKPSACH
jgi:hypothetical protein